MPTSGVVMQCCVRQPYSLLRGRHPRRPSTLFLSFLYETSTIQRTPRRGFRPSGQARLHESENESHPSAEDSLFDPSASRERSRRRDSFRQWQTQKGSHDERGPVNAASEIKGFGLEDHKSNGHAPKPPTSYPVMASDELAIREGVQEQSRIQDRAKSSTMTDVERKAFKKLFDSLSKGITNDSAAQMSQSADGELGRREGAKLYDEFEDDDLSNIDPEFDSSSVNVELFPEELQGMATKAQVEEAKAKRREHVLKKLADQGKEYDPIVVAQRKEFRRIENKLYKADTDVKILEILREDVFPKLAILERRRVGAMGADGTEAAKVLSASTSSSGSRKKAKKKQKSHEASTTSENASKAETESHHEKDKTNEQEQMQRDDDAPSIPTTSYQHIFLLALRLLTRRTRYTALANSLLPTIKSHSLTSSILGTSTALYNEVIGYRWAIFKDMGTILSLLRDMESTGVAANAKTLELLDRIAKNRYNAQQGVMGTAVQALEKMLGRQAEGEELRRQRKQIRANLEAQAMERERHDVLERDMLEADAGGFEEAEGVDSNSMVVSATAG